MRNQDIYSFKKIDSFLYTHGQKTVEAGLADELVKYASEVVWGKPRRCPGIQTTLVELMHNTYDHAGDYKVRIVVNDNGNMIEASYDLKIEGNIEDVIEQTSVPAATEETEEETLWQLKVYLTKTDGTITETVLDIKEPLKAGDLKIIKGELDDQGAVRPYDSTVGISITLDWHEGSIYDPDL
jgi:hypothetical protein